MHPLLYSVAFCHGLIRDKSRNTNFPLETHSPFLFHNRFKQDFLSWPSSLTSDCSLFRDSVSFCIAQDIQISVAGSPLSLVQLLHRAVLLPFLRWGSLEPPHPITCGVVLPSPSWCTEHAHLSRARDREGPCSSFPKSKNKNSTPKEEVLIINKNGDFVY